MEQAVAVLQTAYGPDDRRVAVALNNLALALLGMEDTQGAKLRYLRSLGRLVLTDGFKHPDVATVTANLGRLFQDQKRLDDGRRWLELSRVIHRGIYRPDDPAVDLVNASLLFPWRNIDPEKYKREIRPILASIEKAYGPAHPEAVKIRRALRTTSSDPPVPLFHLRQLYQLRYSSRGTARTPSQSWPVS